MKNMIQQTRFIKDKFSRFLKSTFDIRDNGYKNLYIQRLSELEAKLYKGPYLASALPFEQGKSVNELVSEGLFEHDFLNIGDVDLDRPCYAHQINAFERIINGHNAVVTTGTGSGKTECFMFPIINELIKEIRQGNVKPGVRAIFLFPLNALVYDQIDRLRSLLKNFEEIRFGFYTGKTPENEKTPDGRRKLEEYRRRVGEPYKNELLTREEMRNNPPQILFTNYSMLEYLLIRPGDQKIISKEALSGLRFIVLDEAHTYRGALGVEISLLLKRLQGTAEKKPQFILTSATLGRGQVDLPNIIDFACKLTSSLFGEKDIIFGIRHHNPDAYEYEIKPNDYVALYNNLEDVGAVKSVYEKYRPYNDSCSIKVNLYGLLLKDKNTQTLFTLTNNVGLFFDVLRLMPGFDYVALTALVELVSYSLSDDSKYPLKLYDIKYHMFMKAPDGAFITIGKNKDLSLINVNQINGFKAFKIGICQNCKVPYIMGVTDDADKLCIDDEIDIDETYAEKIKRLEYYLIADCLTAEEIKDVESNPNFEKYFICAKCGYLYKANSALGSCKEHANEYLTVLYKYVGNSDVGDEDIVANNLYKCPICDYKSHNSGIVIGFHVGKDRATTLIAQILYESMEYPVKKVKAEHSLFSKKEYDLIQLKKQFLVFSDSRQQAAFFSKFLNFNNDRFLKKALLWNLLKENNHEKISYLDLVTRLSTVFRDSLGYPEEEAIKHAKATALWELLMVDGHNSGEGIGLFAFKLNLNRGIYNDADTLESILKENGYDNVTASQFKDITARVLSVFRMSPAIKYDPILAVDIEEKRELLGYRNDTIYISLQEGRKQGKDKPGYYPVRSFLPVESKSSKNMAVNNVVKYVKKVLGYDTVKAKDFLRVVFDAAKHEHILVDGDKKYGDTYLIKASDYDLYSYEKLEYYKCKKCNKLTLYNVNGKCSIADCDGELEKCDIDNDDFYKNNYYRNEYMSRQIEKLICREHTAQINADEAKIIQEDFKNGDINFISCSTTFEMGIDLGGLNTVFLRNVPPTPANYAQRAGRAGRRAETSAFILTFCGTSSHDYTFFSEPEVMIRGLVKPPYFEIDNEKIIIRHITATALSLYFREPEYQADFATVENYLKEDVTSKFLNYINSRPVKLGNLIDNYLLLTPCLDDTQYLLNKYGSFKWINYLQISESSLVSMRDGLINIIELYEKARDFAKEQNEFGLAKSYADALDRIKRSSLIRYFTKYNVIPGYGFPVDNVELYIYDYAKQDMDDEYKLSRNLALAISEYAPGSEIIVDGKKYTSRYIFLPYKGDSSKASLPITYYCVCDGCGSINTNQDKNYFIHGRKCKYCGTELNTAGFNVMRYVTPIYGFIADRKNKNTKRMKPFKTYASDVYYVGDNLSATKELNDVVVVTEHKNEELLVLNDNNFFFCSACGYTDLDKHCMSFSKELEHNEYRGRKCTACGSKLHLVHLGYSYRTDIIRIGFNYISNMQYRDTALSVLFAILEGISMTFNIERNDIGGLIYSVENGKPYDLILYDAVAGGAGQVKRLKDNNSLIEVLENALRKVSQDCCAEDTSCYNCLRNYNNQRLHNHIKRGLAKEALTDILTNINLKLNLPK